MKSPAAIEQFNRRLGLLLFSIYLIVYAAFVALVTYDYKLTASVLFGGLNLAIVFGLALIVAAFALALLYMVLARSVPSSPTHPR